MLRSPTCFLVLLLLLSFPLAADQPEGYRSAPLTVGVFPRRSPTVTMRIFSPLRVYLQRQLGLPVRLETAPDFEQFQRRLKQGRYDLVHFNQYHYVKAHDELGYQALVQNEEFGEAQIHGAIYVRDDSGIDSIEQLRGKRILFGGGRQAMMSYVVPSYLLRMGGLGTDDYEERFAISPPNAVLATFLRQADAGGAGEIVRRLPIVKNKIDTSHLRLLAVSEPLSHLPWAVKPDMHPALKQSLRQALIALRDSEQGQEILSQARLTGLNPVNDSDYDRHRVIIEQIEHDR